MKNAECAVTVKISECLDDETLIACLLTRHTVLEAATVTERFGKHYEIVIGIGKDHVAYLTLDDEALSALEKIIERNRDTVNG